MREKRPFFIGEKSEQCRYYYAVCEQQHRRAQVQSGLQCVWRKEHARRQGDFARVETVAERNARTGSGEEGPHLVGMVAAGAGR
jgi:hypothetical protein